MRRKVSIRTIASAVLGLLVVAVAAIVLTGRDDTYTMQVQVADAAGLRDGSPVSIGGVRVGKVRLALGDDDAVKVSLEVQEGKRVPRDARVSISAVNFLGQKQVLFTGGDPRSPAPEGFTFPGERVEVSTDLDQVLGTLDTDTRSRLAILINEAGASVAGRRGDVRTTLEELPDDLAEAHEVLARLVSDNTTLGDVVERTDAFIATFTRQRAELVKLIDTFGETSDTVVTKRAELASTLRRAPRTLRTLQGFMGKLERTTVPLGPAARQIDATAPLLDETLSKVAGFREAADPALDRAAEVAPTLTELAGRATPVLRKAEPTIRSLSLLVPAAKPVSGALAKSSDNISATIEAWSQAIQLRDNLSHVFRGEATYTPDAVISALDRLNPPAKRKGRRKSPKQAPATTAPSASRPGAPSPSEKPGAAPGELPETLKDVTDRAAEAVDGILDQLLPQPQAPAPNSTNRGEPLLDLLLGP